MSGLSRTFYAGLATLLTWAAARKIARAQRLAAWAKWAEAKAGGRG